MAKPARLWQALFISREAVGQSIRLGAGRRCAGAPGFLRGVSWVAFRGRP